MGSVSELVVSVGAIARNLRAVRRRVGDRSIMAAVKADAYGHGAVAVSRLIQNQGLADWLGVALVSEGVQLRDAGIELPILKLSPAFPDELPKAIAADLALTVVDERTIAQAEQAAKKARRLVPVHLKLDTGMRRIGMLPDAARELIPRIMESVHLNLEGLFTHLPISDVPAGEQFTVEQLALFNQAAKEALEIAGSIPFISAANSGAIMMHDLGASTMVRPGIMIYGSAPDPLTFKTIPLHPVVRWTTRLLFIKPVTKGETVGYGRSWTAPRDTWIGTVEIGYGDGYSRLLSNRGRMLIDGRSYPIVGRVCMDQTMIDLGPVQPEVEVGDEVVLIGTSGPEEITVAEIAALMGTIPYEVTCLITPRVPRRYVE